MSLKVIKRDGRLKDFDSSRIEVAITKAMKNGSGRIDVSLAKEISKTIENTHSTDTPIPIGAIEKAVFELLCGKGHQDTARAYENYRSIREYQRRTNTVDDSIMELVSGESEYWNTENSNKDATVVTTQRDYLAGIISTDVSKRKLIPLHIVQAHEEGIIHFHDMDYFLQKALNNCGLINLEDMLQNGTVINGRAIDKPHRFSVAMTIATQIITAVASSQYGGTSITLTHLAPFVRDSYKEHYAKYISRGSSEEESKKYALQDLKVEITGGVQTFNYQINSMSTTNGQSPFISVFMYLGETEEYKEELAMIIEEFLHQRIQGMKNEVGVYVTQEFPKLLYVTEPDNIYEDSKYFYLTTLSAKCTAKRLVPDYISEKEMKRLKEDNCFPCMG